MKNNNISRRRQSGFSLIELSILLTILALVAVVSMSWFMPSTIDEARKLQLTRQRIHTIEQALRTFRVTQGRLPCAAVRDLDDTDPKNGEENCTGVGIYNLGVVPARTIGIALTNMVDGWGRRFTYQVSTDLCGLGSVGNETTPINCTSITYAAGDGDLIVRSTDPENPTTDPADGINLNTAVAYVIVSHGANGDGAWMPSGAQRNAGVASDKEEMNITRPTASPAIIAPDATYWYDPYNSEFDDFIAFATKDQIEYITADYDRRVLTQTECTNEISTTLSGITLAAEVTAMDAISLDGLENASDEMLRVLWYAQEVCREYYPSAYPADANVKCPGGRAFDSTNASAPDNPVGYCDCPAGAPTWTNGSGCS